MQNITEQSNTQEQRSEIQHSEMKLIQVQKIANHLISWWTTYTTYKQCHNIQPQA